MQTQNRTMMDANLEYDDIAPGVSEDEKRTGSKRVLQIIAGVLLVLAGIPLMPLPGPGWVTVLIGLNLIKPDNFLVRWLRRRIPGIPEEGAIPKSHLVIGGLFFVGSTALSVLYGDDVTSWVRNQL